MFDWDDANVGHIARHNVSRHEAEEALLDRRRRYLKRQVVRGELRYPVLGATGDGRVLFVVFTKRRDRVRVVMARDAEEREERRYRQE